MESNRPMTCLLKVDTQSPGWEKSLTKVIKRVKDVSYSIDARYGVICISGVIDPKKLLSDIKKAGKHAVLIQAECGGGHSPSHYHSNNTYGGSGSRGYRIMEPHQYPYYEAQLGRHGYINFYPHMNQALPAPAADPNHAPRFPSPSAPPLNYESYIPNCNIM